LWRSLIVVIFTLATAGAVCSFASRPAGGQAGVRLVLPDLIGNYLGFDDSSIETEKRLLPVDTEIVKKNYLDSSSSVSCELVLSGALKSSIHRPQVCLIAQGWTILDDHPVVITLADGQRMRVRLLTLSRPSQNGITIGYYLYWFVGKDKTTDDHLQRVLWSIWDRLTRNIVHRWAYVIVSDAVTVASGQPDEQLRQQHTQKVESFAAELAPAIQLPQVRPQG
jgi:Protein of unknown function (DUF3485)